MKEISRNSEKMIWFVVLYSATISVNIKTLNIVFKEFYIISSVNDKSNNECYYLVAVYFSVIKHLMFQLMKP